MDSRRFSGIAPQLTVTKARPERSEEPWMARAISSLPAPDSPSIRIGMLDCAARCPRRNTWRISDDLATRSSKTSRFSVFFLSRRTSPESVPILSWLRMETAMRSGLAGLTRKSLAPARIASTAESMPPLAVSTITGSAALLARSLARTWSPSMSGMTRSSNTQEMCSPRGPSMSSRAGRAKPGQPHANMILGAVHFLLLRGAEHPLKRFYATVGGTVGAEGEDPFPDFRDFIGAHRDAIARLIEARVTNTNEVARSTIL